MAIINHNIGYLKNVIETARRAGELTTLNTKSAPYDQFTDYDDVRSGSVDSKDSQGVFHWGVHNWADGNNLVGS